MEEMHSEIDTHSKSSLSNSGIASKEGCNSRERSLNSTRRVKGDVDGHIHNSYYQRLYRYYELYNPQKLHLIPKYLQEYRGEEEQLFAILVSKYGPEPGAPQKSPKGNQTLSSSEGEPALHYSGKRCRFPKHVSPHEGNTDFETPYWAGSNLVSDRDLLYLLLHLETQNTELQKCYMGLFAQHPTSAWNGMCYITKAEWITNPCDTLLGHTWATTHVKSKILFHEGRTFRRLAFYCTEECQKRASHERWRLTIYRSEFNSLILLRTMWDPIVVPEPLPLFNSNASEGNALLSSDSSSTPFLSAYSECNSSVQPSQPEQLSFGMVLSHFNRIVGELENKLLKRLDMLEERINRLEQEKNM